MYKNIRILSDIQLSKITSQTPDPTQTLDPSSN